MLSKNTISRKDAARKIIIGGLLTAAVVLIISIFFPVKNGNKVCTNEDRIRFISSFGWEVETQTIKEQTISLPEEFPDVLEKYNQLQTQQGYDLKKYAGKEIEMYTYRVLNYPDVEDVQCSLYVYKNRIIGGDIHSTAFSGFMRGLQG